MREATYFFTNEAYHDMPYNALTKANLRKIWAQIVVFDLEVVKHYKLISLGTIISPEKLQKWKDDWNGVVVKTPCL